MGRTRRQTLPQLLEDGQSAVVLIDADHKIRLVSAGMQQLTGWTEEDLLLRKCERAAPRTSAAVEIFTCALAPSADVWGGSMALHEAVVSQRDEAPLKLRLCFIPLKNAAGEVDSVLIAAERLASGQTITTVTSVSQRLHAEINALRLDLRRRFGNDSYMAGCSEMRVALRQAELISHTKANFVIVGPEGSGRRHLARLIHRVSALNESVCAVLNCHLLTTENLLTTLHQLRISSASHSGLPHQRVGLLVLTEVDQLPIEVQHWLRKNGHLSENGPKDGRLTHAGFTNDQLWMAATTTRESALQADGGMLIPELISALTTIRITLPALHARGEDVLLLSQLFMQENRRDRQTIAESLSEEVQRKLLEYRWPGQVRELKIAIEAACKASKTPELGIADLPMSFRAGQEAQRQQSAVVREYLPLPDLLHAYEMRVIGEMLDECRGNKTEAARRLGLTRPKLYRRMKTLGLDPDE